MYRKNIIALIIVFLSFSLISCGAKETSEPSPATEVIMTEPAIETTSVVQPTRVKPTVVPPTPIPTQPPKPTEPPSQPFYKEEFETEPKNWFFEIFRGDKRKVDIEAGDGVLAFNIEALDTYAYAFYEDFEYEDVYLEASVKNHGYNNNMITLVCRYSRSGFYEVNIKSDGMYDIYVYLADKGYYRLYNGGSRRINTGLTSNVFAMSCQDNEIELYVNDYLERTVTDNKYNLPEGLIGVGVSAFDSIPVTVDFDYVLIEEP